MYMQSTTFLMILVPTVCASLQDFQYAYIYAFAWETHFLTTTGAERVGAQHRKIPVLVIIS